MVSVFEGSFRPEPIETVPLADILERIRQGTYRPQVERLRQLLQAKCKAVYASVKRSSIAFTPAGVFQRRANAALVKASGLLNFDFDGVADCAEAKAKLSSDPWIVYAFDSPSGHGLKVAVWASGIIDDTTYKHAWSKVLTYFQ